MAEPSCSSGKKRARDDANDDDHNGATAETLGLEHNLTFSDTMVALRMMRAQFPKVNKVHMQPFILRSQLYSSVKDRTQVDRDLETRQLIDPNMYWFAIPNIGPILKGLSQGRKELLSFLNRRKYKEMLLAPLEKKRLRLSPLDMRFHLRDLIGSGHLKTIQTPTGLLVRMSKD